MANEDGFDKNSPQEVEKAAKAYMEMKEVERARKELVEIAFDLGTFHGKITVDMELLRAKIATLESRLDKIEGILIC